MNSASFCWTYAYLDKNGYIIDEETGKPVNDNLPSFRSVAEAEYYIEENNLRITLK